MAERPVPPQASPAEAAVVVAICFGVFVAWWLASSFGAARDGFNDAGFGHTVLLECVLGGFALTWLRRRGWPLAALLPWPSWRGSAAGIVLCLAALLAWIGLAQVVDLSAYAVLPHVGPAGAPRPSPSMVVLAAAVNGVYEETFLVGYLVRGFRHRGAAAAVGVSVLVRLLCHLYQGPLGALGAVVFGTLAAAFYWRSRWLWPVAFAHMLQDMISLASG